MTDHDPLTIPEDNEISLLDLLQTVVDNLRLLVLGPLLVGLAALGITFLIPPTFTASTQFLPPQQQQSATAATLQSLGALGGQAGATKGIRDPNDQFVAFLQSRTLRDALIERFKLQERFQARFPEDARNGLASKVRISNGKDGLIRVEVDDTVPAFAAELANAHVQELTLLLGRLALTEAQQRRVFFENQLSETKARLAQAEQALQTIGVNLNLLKAAPPAAVVGLAQLQASVTAQEVKLAAMRGYLADSAPDFRQAMTERAVLRAQLDQAEKSQPPTPAGDSAQLAKLRDFKYFETLVQLLAEQQELARLDESREGAVIQVLDVAQAPERESKPPKALIAVPATLATGFALLLFVFVRQALRNAAQDDGSAQKLQRLREAWARALGRHPRTT